MNAIFFLDVDTQRDLMLSGGALYVPGAERMAPKLRRLFDFARKHDIFILSTVDAHSRDDPEFANVPVHCLRKTDGQRKIDDTLLPRSLIFENKPLNRNLLEALKKHRQIIVEKQTHSPFDNPVTEKLLKALPQHAIVFGVPLEHSVLQACLGLRRSGIKTALITDAVGSLDPHAAARVFKEMQQRGVELITTEALMGT